MYTLLVIIISQTHGGVSMQKVQKIFAIIVAAAALLSIVIIALTAADYSDKDKAYFSDSVLSGDMRPLYIMKEYNGYLAVFNYGSNAPTEVLSVLITDLPEYDQRELRYGLAIYSEQELQQRIEDFDS